MLVDAIESSLPCGIRIVTADMPRVESVSVGIWVGAGGRHEAADKSGISHFIEHLLFKGTNKMSASDISRAVEGCGGYINAFTQEEMTCFYARAAYNHARKMLGILCDMFLNARFDEADIERERNVIIEEIMMYRDRPDYVVQDLLDSLLWKNHQLGRPLIGSPASLRQIAREDIVKFKERRYAAERTVFVLTGRIRHDEAVEWVQKFMEEYPASRPPASKPVNSGVRQDRMILRAKDIEQAQLAMGFRTFGFFDARRFALKALSVILGENMSSRLFRVVREKNGLAYSIHSSVNLFSDTGCLVISAGLDKERRRKALDLIAREIVRLKQDGVKSAELARAKEYAVGHLRMSMESPSGQMMWLGTNMLNYETVIHPEDVIDTLYGLSTHDIQSVAERSFRPNLVSLAMLSPGLDDGDEDHARSVLAAI